MVNYFKRTALGIGYATLFSLLAMVVSYAFRLVLARNLGPEQFGLFYAVLTFVLFVSLIREPGLKSAVVKFLPEWLIKKDYRRINLLLTQTLLTWLSVAALLIAVFAPLSGWLANHYFGDVDAQLLLVVLLFAFLLNSIDYLLAYVFQGHQRLGISTSVDFVRVVSFLLIALIGFTIYPRNVLVPAFAYLATSVLLIAAYLPVLVLKVDRNIRLVKPRREFYAEAIAFGLPVTAASLLYTGFQMVSILVLTYFRPLAEVGLFNIAVPTSALLINLAASISIAIFPLASELSAKGLERRLEAGTSLLYRYTFLAVVPLSLMLFVYADLIIVLLFGEQYLGAVAALKVLSIGTVFWIIANINFNILAGLGKSREPLKIVLAIALLLVVLNFTLVPVWGMMGAAVAMVFGYVAAMVLSVVSLRRYLHLRIPFGFWIKGFTAAMAFVGLLAAAKRITNLNPYVEAAIVVAIAGAAYVALLFALRLVTYAELSSHMRTILRKEK